MRNLRLLLAIFVAVVIAGPGIAAEEVDLLLVLASDVSRSVDAMILFDVCPVSAPYQKKRLKNTGLVLK